MLFYIFTVDGDWKGYFDLKLNKEERLPKVESMQSLIENETSFAKENLSGKFIHFIHSSPCVRNFFLNQPFLDLWKEIVKNQGDVGLHCHEDDPHKAYYIADTKHMDEAITSQSNTFRDKGLELCCYRGGYLAFSNELIPILEKNKLTSRVL